MNLYEWTVPQYSKMLTNLSGLLDKAAAYADHKKFDANVLLSSRLAPDQFPFVRQVQIACDTAKLSVSRLTGKSAPSHEDNETTITQLKARIQEVIKYLSNFKESDFTSAETISVTQQRWEGKTLSGSDYCVQHAVPNFYFHVTTAYSILRHNGVDVGKKDFLGPMPFRS